MRESELIDRVAGSTGLTPAEAARVVDDVVAWYREPVEDFVRRRHAQYRLLGKHNPEIFALIEEELASRLVAAPALSQRQLRRIIYDRRTKGEPACAESSVMSAARTRHPS